MHQGDSQDVRRACSRDCRAVVVGGPDPARPREFTSGTGLREAGPSAGGPSRTQFQCARAPSERRARYGSGTGTARRGRRFARTHPGPGDRRRDGTGDRARPDRIDPRRGAHGIGALRARSRLPIGCRGPGHHDVSFVRRFAGDIDGSSRKLIRIGLSEALSVDRLEEAVDHAKLATAAAECGGVPLEFTAFAGRALLSIDSTRQVLNAVADTLLTPLCAYDRDHGTDLLVSLRAFLEANGHWETAASAVGVHRHTLRKRMTFVQELTGCNLDVARVRAELLLALLAYQS
ncbi:hypothetical protein EB73_12845 [Mycobacterium sp. SWH-M3]|nr:hypothetical protein EB73_12845 [Mycobacterium sp. SWH-M3]